MPIGFGLIGSFLVVLVVLAVLFQENPLPQTGEAVFLEKSAGLNSLNAFICIVLLIE